MAETEHSEDVTDLGDAEDIFSPWNDSSDFSMASDAPKCYTAPKENEDKLEERKSKDENEGERQMEDEDKLEEDEFEALLRSEEDALFLEVDSASMALESTTQEENDIHMATQESNKGQNMVRSSSLCFHTAAGSEVHVSEEAINRARKLLGHDQPQQVKKVEQQQHKVSNEMNEEALSEEEENVPKEQEKRQNDVEEEEIKSKVGKPEVCKQDLEEKTKCSSSSNDLHNRAENEVRPASPIPLESSSASHGFRTAAGTSVVVSAEALERARRRFEETEKENDVKAFVPKQLSRLSSPSKSTTPLRALTSTTPSSATSRTSLSNTPLSRISAKTPLSAVSTRALIGSRRTTLSASSATPASSPLSGSSSPLSSSSVPRRMSLGMRRRSFVSPSLTTDKASPLARPQNDQRQGARSAFRPPQMKRARTDESLKLQKESLTAKIAFVEDEVQGSAFGNSVESQDFEELMRNLD